MFVHRHSHGANARLLLIPSERYVRLVPDGESLESALAEAIDVAS